MYNRVVPFLEKCNIFSNSQFGFRKVKSINGALYTFSTNILSAKDKEEHVLGLFLELWKAIFEVVGRINISGHWCP